MLRSAEEDVEDLRQRNKALILQLQRFKQKERDSTEAQRSTEAEEELPVPGGDRGATLRVTFSDPAPRPPSVVSDLRPDLTHPESLKHQSALRSEERLRPPPLLGYDWIAGVIDTDDSLMERSDEFFSELCSFRALHREQCVTSSDEFPEESDPSLSSRSEVDTALRDTHQCTFSYRINSRLFPVPLSSQECCPICKKLKSDHPHTTKDPALVRVSVPCAVVLPPHQYRAHRRSSFEPSDSLSLPSHCLSGWSNSTHSSLTAPRNLDLRSSVDTKKKNKDLEDLPVFRASRQKPPALPQASLLTRHHFQHFPPRKHKHVPF